MGANYMRGIAQETCVQGHEQFAGISANTLRL